MLSWREVSTSEDALWSLLPSWAIGGTVNVASIGESVVGDLSGNRNALFVSAARGTTCLSSFPTASGFGLLGLPNSTSSGKLASLLRRLSLEPISSDPLREVDGLSSEPLLLLLLDPGADPFIAPPVMLIRAIISGEGERRIPSGASVIGDEGADEVKGRDVRFSGSGRLNGAGAGSACVI